ncbi:MAG: M24 family metallopeptidase [Chitinophagaceae bacterium]
MIHKLKYFFASFLLTITIAQAQVLPLKNQAVIIDEILSERFNHLLPQLMQDAKVEMWLLISREYHEDPVLKTMLPATWLNARRTTMLVFYRNSTTGAFKKMAITRYNVGSEIEAVWDMKKFPNQWEALNNVITQHNPQNIAVNFSPHFAHADGLTHTEYQQLQQFLSKENKAKLISGEKLAINWLATRTKREMEIYPQLIKMSKDIIAEGFSSKVITPGITTSDDLVWWYRQAIADKGLSTWFHPSVEIQRNDAAAFDHLKAFSNKGYDPKNIIRPGDLLHVDFGITYLRLNTDIQEHAYVLLPGEKEAPLFLQKAMGIGNRLQDILTNEFVLGRTGNQMLASALQKAKQEGIEAVIYSHPIGYHGHAAGPAIGLWDQQQGVPGSGDVPLEKNTCFSIELNAAVWIKEWNKPIRIMLEQDGFYGEDGFRYINGRQTQFHLIGNDR